MGFEGWRDRLRRIIEHDGEYFRKWHICKSAISWRSRNRDTFPILFGHAVIRDISSPLDISSSFWILTASDRMVGANSCHFSHPERWPLTSLPSRQLRASDQRSW
jgi:hypothetical protein